MMADAAIAPANARAAGNAQQTGVGQIIAGDSLNDGPGGRQRRADKQRHQNARQAESAHDKRVIGITRLHSQDGPQHVREGDVVLPIADAHRQGQEQQDDQYQEN